jgi:predicted NUDIX family NTP pyrophosphohydrolase
MGKASAGLLPYRWREGSLEVFLVHPGGPFWTNRDEQSWSIAKGEAEPREDLLDAARREFAEETGLILDGPVMRLAPVRQRSGKTVHAWAMEAEIDPAVIRSNSFPMEWPPGSGRVREFPEVDRAGWFGLSDARRKIHAGQLGLLEELEAALGNSGPPPRR